MKKRRNYEELGDVTLPPEQVKIIEQMIEDAERELEEVRVNFRWGKAQLQKVKQAAKAIGVPYQTYIKQVVFRQSLRDLPKAA